MTSIGYSIACGCCGTTSGACCGRRLAPWACAAKTACCESSCASCWVPLSWRTSAPAMALPCGTCDGSSTIGVPLSAGGGAGTVVVVTAALGCSTPEDEEEDTGALVYTGAVSAPPLIASVVVVVVSAAAAGPSARAIPRFGLAMRALSVSRSVTPTRSRFGAVPPGELPSTLIGMMNWKVVLVSASVVEKHQIRPPSSSTRCSQMARPSPVPW
mmetsp:Transcript_11638/g.34863  ORF Transcript_11638/g.34863 Transcript_11638/m.34863 type:complete len:214 (+) Transcript_11638:885-1526(+)